MTPLDKIIKIIASCNNTSQLDIVRTWFDRIETKSGLLYEEKIALAQIWAAKYTTIEKYSYGLFENDFREMFFKG